MFIKASDLCGYRLSSLDGEIGTVREFYFDDDLWVVRYLVADTGSWMSERAVLLAPNALERVSRKDAVILVKLSRKQIQESPTLLSDEPVSRQFETAYFGYFGWPSYWSGAQLLTAAPFVERNPGTWSEAHHRDPHWDPNLRSTQDVRGRNIQATDGNIGHINDFIIDDETWSIRYLVVDTQNWWPAKKVLIAPKWIESIGDRDCKAIIQLTREAIRRSPQYSEAGLITREYEAGLHRHYNQEGYWVEDSAASAQVAL